jgi:hypothetical protein
MASSPLLETMLQNLVDAITVADPEAGDRVYRTLRNEKVREAFAETFQRPSGPGSEVRTTHAWEIDYKGIQERREDEAGDLFWTRHGFDLHFWYGPYNDRDETIIESAEIALRTTDELEGLDSVFSQPMITERTVLLSVNTLEQFGPSLHSHTVISVEITATQFKAL